jgi:hypothetical protein
MTCHGGHKVPPVDPGVAGGWADTFLNTECKACHASLGDLAAQHDWLFQAEFHFRGKLQCHWCHTGSASEKKGHILSRDAKPLRECTACHTPGSTLSERIGGKAAEGALFTDQPVADKVGYVMGATRIKLLDLIGGLLVIATFVGMVFGHGGLRFLVSMMKKKDV